MHRLVSLVGSVARRSKLNDGHGGRRRSVVVRWLSPDMAHSGEDGYSILVTELSYTVQVRARGVVGELGRVHGHAGMHGAQRCSQCFGYMAVKGGSPSCH